MSRPAESRSSRSARGQMPLMLNGRKKKASAAPALGGTVHKVVGLFAGIGGVERGLGRSGHETLLFCENDPAAMAVLSHRFPGISHHDDVRTLRALPEDTTLVVAGFPCQDLSQAGTTKGLAGSRSGLVGEVFRLIEAHRTPWLLLENVPFMLQLGRGEAMNVITERLEDLGYRWAYRVVDSRAFGLPQRRRRIYLVASLEGDPRQVLFADEAGARSEPELNGHPVACGFYWTEGLRGLGWAVDAVPTLKGGSTIGIPSPPAIWMPDGRVVTPDIRDAERLQGFTPGWTSAAERVAKKGARWKLVGNAVSVPAAAWIGRRMRKPGHLADFETFPLHDNRRWPVAAWNVGEGRVGTVASEWPLERPTPSLEAFLKHAPSLLSARATGGFLGRARQARLRFPKGFLAAIEKHLDRVAQ